MVDTEPHLDEGSRDRVDEQRLSASLSQAPPPPPLPSLHNIKPSSIAYKVRSAPPGWAYDCGVITAQDRDPLAPPTGPYFFYGTLQDPAMLSEILDLPENPTLRPAHIIGYHLELWGQYPALVDGPPGNLVRGLVWDVPTEEAAAKLAAYETRSYHAAPCNVYEGFERVGRAPLEGYTFVYCGARRDLTEGSFDLNVWLRRMGRKAVNQTFVT